MPDLFILQLGDENKFPLLLKNFEKKDYVITLSINERNVNKTSNIYRATDISDPVEVLGNHSPPNLAAVSLTEEPLVTPAKAPVLNPAKAPIVENTNNGTAPVKNSSNFIINYII